MISSCLQPVQESEVPSPSRGPEPASFRRRLGARVGHWFGGTARKGGIALIDQMIVSGCSFLATVLIGRLCGPTELGIYSLGFTIVFLLVGILQALAAVPYTIYVHRMQDEKREAFAGGVLVHCGFLALAAMAGLAVASCAPSLGLGPPAMAPVAAVLAVTVPFFLLREFARRFAFAHLQMAAALVFDACVAGLQIVLLIFLVAWGQLTAVTVFAASGLCYAVVGATWLYRVRSRFVVSWKNARTAWSHNWGFSKWLLADQTALTMNSYLMHWLLAAILGVSATGLFAACATILCAFNPIVLGLNNLIMPRIAMAMSRGDRDEMRRVLWKTTLVIGTLTGLFCGALLVFGRQIVALLYGTAYAGQEGLIAVLAIDMFIGSLATAPGYGIWAMQGSRKLFFIRLLRIGVAATITVGLANRLGPIAAAYGLLSGSIVGVVLIYCVHHTALAAQNAASASAQPSLEEELAI